MVTPASSPRDHAKPTFRTCLGGGVVIRSNAVLCLWRAQGGAAVLREQHHRGEHPRLALGQLGQHAARRCQPARAAAREAQLDARHGLRGAREHADRASSGACCEPRRASVLGLGLVMGATRAGAGRGHQPARMESLQLHQQALEAMERPYGVRGGCSARQAAAHLSTRAWR